MKKPLIAIATAIVLGSGMPPAAAQLVIGQTSGFSGGASAGVIENTRGARLWLEHVNARGGVHGQAIKLVSLDDGFRPDRALENARQLITQHKALLLFLNRGTANTEALRPVLEQHGIALLAPSTGASIFHAPVHRWIFNVRPSYPREAERAVQLLASLGLQRIALVHVDDSAGLEAVAGARKGFELARLSPAFVHKFDRQKPVFDAAVKGVLAADAQAVMLLGSAAAVAAGTHALRAAGSRATIVTSSNNAAEGFIRLMGAHARGTIVTQVFPSERALAVPMVKEAHDLALAAGLRGVTPAMLEGYAAAKVLVEALRQAGPNPTRGKLRNTIEAMRHLDIGGLQLGYGPGDHTGLEYTDLSVIDSTGKFLR